MSPSQAIWPATRWEKLQAEDREMDHEAEVVEQLVREEVIGPLTKQTFDDELSGLCEDVMNWNCGHPCVPVLPTSHEQ